MRYGLGLLLLLVGCSVTPISYKVTGKSGKQYVAPDLCQALIQCQNSGEASCSYVTDRQTDFVGDQAHSFTTVCKTIQTK